MTDNNHQILQDVRRGKIQPTTADWYTLTGMFERTRMRHIINSMPNEATARAVAEAISTQWHQFVKDMSYTEMWEVELVALQNGSEPWHCALTPPLSEYNNIDYEHIEDVLHTYITEFFTTNNRQSEEPSATPTTATTPPAEPQQQNPSGRKKKEIDTPEKMKAKAAELKAKWNDEKGDQPMVITETGMHNEVNQFIIDFMAEWACERKILQNSGTAPAPAVRFLSHPDYGGLKIEGIEWKSWKAHTAKEIPIKWAEKKEYKK